MGRFLAGLKSILGALGVALSAIAAIFGASWLKRKLEARGAQKQHERQQAAADEVEEGIAQADEEIDREADEQLEAIDAQREQLAEDLEETLAGDPTEDHVDALIEESKT